MPSRKGCGNKLKGWDSQRMLDKLSHSLSERDMVLDFTLLPPGERWDVLTRLAETVSREIKSRGPE